MMNITERNRTELKPNLFDSTEEMREIQKKKKTRSHCRQIVKKHVCDNQFIPVNFYGYILFYAVFLYVFIADGYKFCLRDLIKSTGFFSLILMPFHEN